MKTRHFVGNYRTGFEFVRLYVDTDTGNGSVKLIPVDNGATSVYVGIDSPWGVAIATLLHEVYELNLIRMNTRYEPQPSLSNDSSDFMFFMTHNQLSEVHERVAMFLEKALPDFSKAYQKYSKYED